MIDQTLHQSVIVTNPQGFHMRPVRDFAVLAMKYQCEVHVLKGDRRVDGRSVLELMTLGAVPGTELIIEVSGPDANEALPALVKVVNSEPGKPAH